MHAQRSYRLAAAASREHDDTLAIARERNLSRVEWRCGAGLPRTDAIKEGRQVWPK
jgi:hypothetical protein